MSTTLATKMKKTVKGQANGKVITAVFENGVLKPLIQVRLPERKTLTVIVQPKKKSIAEEMYGLLKLKNHAQLDTIIESEDWL